MCRLLLLTGSVIQLGRLCSAQSEQCLRLGEDQAALLLLLRDHGSRSWARLV
jgi:hypothetical protein